MRDREGIGFAAAGVAACLAIVGIGVLHQLSFEWASEWVSWVLFATIGLLVGSAYAVFGGGTRTGLAFLFVLSALTGLAAMYVSLNFAKRELRGSSVVLMWAGSDFESLASLGDELKRASTNEQRTAIRARELESRWEGQGADVRPQITRHFEEWELPRARAIATGSLDRDRFMDDWFDLQISIDGFGWAMWVKLLVAGCSAAAVGSLGLRESRRPMDPNSPSTDAFARER